MSQQAHLLHAGELRGGADAGHRQTDVQGGADTLVEQLSLQEDLAVSDGNHVGGNIGGHITGLRRGRKSYWARLGGGQPDACHEV